MSRPIEGIDWEPYRRDDQTIDLKKAFGEHHHQGTMKIAEWGLVVNYFRSVEQLQPINSRQAAAILIVNARNLVLSSRNRL